MLVVTRKLNEAIVIGDGIEIVILGTEAKASGFITAPSHAGLPRDFYDTIRAANVSRRRWRRRRTRRTLDSGSNNGNQHRHDSPH